MMMQIRHGGPRGGSVHQRKTRRNDNGNVRNTISVTRIVVDGDEDSTTVAIPTPTHLEQ